MNAYLAVLEHGGIIMYEAPDISYVEREEEWEDFESVIEATEDDIDMYQALGGTILILDNDEQ